MRACSPGPRRRAVGFTLVESMMSMLILAVGVLGVMSMQTATTSATRTSQDFTQAQAIGERMLELLRMDALRWTTSGASGIATQTRLMKAALPGSETVGLQSDWVTIPDNTLVTAMGGKKVDRNFVPDTGGSPEWPLGFRYCVYYRMAWAAPPTWIRADVRVAWARDVGLQSRLRDCINDKANVADLANVRSVTMATTLMQNNVL